MKIGYARVSTKDQQLNLQIDALEKSGCERIYREKLSGAQRDRPELKLALDYLRPGDTLVVWKLDRLARSTRQLIDTVQDLNKRDIGFVSLTETIDTTTAGGTLIFHIFAALAEFERGMIRERVVAGLVSARSRGQVPGRPKKWDSMDTAAAIALMKANRSMRVKLIAAKLGVSPSTLYRYLPGGRSANDAIDGEDQT